MQCADALMQPVLDDQNAKESFVFTYRQDLMLLFIYSLTQTFIDTMNYYNFVVTAMSTIFTKKF